MSDDLQKVETPFSDEQLDTLAEIIQKLDEAMINSIEALNVDDEPDSGYWVLILAFYIDAKAEQQGVPAKRLLKALIQQTKWLKKKFGQLPFE